MRPRKSLLLTLLAIVAGGGLFAAAWRESEPRRQPVTVVAAPREVQVLFEKGREQYRRKEYKDAKKSFEQCLALSPAYADCHKLLGATLGMLGDGEAGAKEYERFLKHAPADHPQRAKVEQLLRTYRQYTASMK